MDAHHDVLTASLQCDWEHFGLVRMDGVHQFVHHDEYVVVLFDGWWRWVHCARFYLNHYWCCNFCQPDSFLLPFMCPFCFLSKSGKCLRIRVVVRPGHVA